MNSNKVDEIKELLRTTGAILEGHFQLTSGKHSSIYLEKFRLLERPQIVDKIGKWMAKPFMNKRIEVVLGAATGGILLSYATARVLGALGMFAERVGGELKLRRGFRLQPNQRVLIVEDVVTTGGSIKELLRIIKNDRAKVVGMVCLVDRSESGLKLDIPMIALTTYPIPTWEPNSCPLCQSGQSLQSRGRTGKL